MRSSIAALLVVLTLPSHAQPVEVIVEAAALHASLERRPEVCEGRRVRLPVDSGGVELEGRRVLYRMVFNQVTEGWNWHPEAAAADGDYYRFKYLPLGSVAESRGVYAAEDKIGTPQEFRIEWRYDYFLAFDNLYDFFPRRTDDDAGFAAELPAAVKPGLTAGDIDLVAVAVLRSPCVAQSTTFWKATHARPLDFTLKKRYLLGELEAVQFIDRRDGRVLVNLGKSAPAGR